MAALFRCQLLLQGSFAVVQQQILVVLEVALAAVLGDEGMGTGFTVSSVTNTTISWLSAKACSIKSKAASSAALAVCWAFSRSSARVWNWARSRSKAGCVLAALARRSSASQAAEHGLHLQAGVQRVRLSRPAARCFWVSAS